MLHQEFYLKTESVLNTQSKKIIESIIQLIIETFDIDTTRPINAKKLAKSLGFSFGTIKGSYSNDYKGVLLLNPYENIPGFNTKKVIGYSDSLTYEENQKIIAHELGHYFLHFKQGKIQCDYKYRDNENEKKSPRELEANYFAAALLLPKTEFIRLYNLYKNNDNIQNFIGDISQLYGVETRCVSKRIVELGL